MAANQPLTDKIRVPWILAILAHLTLLYRQGKSVALAYSGLKYKHREMFRALPFSCQYYYLFGEKIPLLNESSNVKIIFFVCFT